MSIKDFILGMEDWFRLNILNKLPKWVASIAPEIFDITGRIRKLMEDADIFLNGNLIKGITDIIPGEWDDKLRDDASKWLVNAIPVVQKMEDCNGDLLCILQNFVAALKHETPAGAEAKLQKLASKILAERDGNKLKENRYNAITQVAYSKLVAA